MTVKELISKFPEESTRIILKKIRKNGTSYTYTYTNPLIIFPHYLDHEVFDFNLRWYTYRIDLTIIIKEGS